MQHNETITHFQGSTVHKMDSANLVRERIWGSEEVLGTGSNVPVIPTHISKSSHCHEREVLGEQGQNERSKAYAWTERKPCAL